MGENSVILQGIENDSAKHSLCSTVHGAGRVMVRMEAKGKTDRKTGEVKRVGKVTQEMMDGWLERGNVELRGAGSDESPDYKRLPDVLAEHGDSIKILHTLTPVGVAMAGANEFDVRIAASEGRATARADRRDTSRSRHRDADSVE